MEPGLRALVDDAMSILVPPLPDPWPAAGQPYEEWAADVAARREEHEQAGVTRAAVAAAQAGPVTAPPVAEVTDVAVPIDDGTITARVYVPQGSPPLPALVVLHGGGYWIGGGKVGLEAGDVGCRTLCAALSSVVVNVDYRQAPEHRFPIPLEDCYAATRRVAEHSGDLGVDPERVSIMGASAGANLAIGVALLARDRGGPPLRFQLLLVPAVDPTMSYPSVLEHAQGTDLTRATVALAWDFYFGPDGDRTNPLAAVLGADLAGLPPAHVVVAEFDPIRDEGVAFADRLKAAGVETTLTRHPMTHGIAEPHVAAAYLADAVAAVDRANQ